MYGQEIEDSSVGTRASDRRIYRLRLLEDGHPAEFRNPGGYPAERII